MGLPKFIVNLDELAKPLENGLTLSVLPSDEHLRAWLEARLEQLADTLRVSISPFAGYAPCAVGLRQQIPAVVSDYPLRYTFQEKGFLTGVSYAQSAWKPQDAWSLYADGQPLFESLFTKELGEYKHFAVFFALKPGAEVTIVHHNRSGNSKQLWFDLNYLKEV